MNVTLLQYLGVKKNSCRELGEKKFYSTLHASLRIVNSEYCSGSFGRGTDPTCTGSALANHHASVLDLTLIP